MIIIIIMFHAFCHMLLHMHGKTISQFHQVLKGRYYVPNNLTKIGWFSRVYRHPLPSCFYSSSMVDFVSLSDKFIENGETSFFSCMIWGILHYSFAWP